MNEVYLNNYWISLNQIFLGLRTLSLKVRDIVFRDKKSSYKEVADKLIENLKQENHKLISVTLSWRFPPNIKFKSLG